MIKLMECERMGLTYDLVVIAEGTEWATTVRDVRREGRWARSSMPTINMDKRAIVYHHTAGGLAVDYEPLQQLQVMELARNDGEWGLPYNFIVFPGKRGKVWYLNDVDSGWPHTLGYNWATAIAAWGNYSVAHPDPRLVQRMMRLADALASMWGRWVPEIQHADVMPTQCPGNHLRALLPSQDRQRGL